MTAHRSFHFTRAITRLPASTINNGLREGDGGDPDADIFRQQHTHYRDALIKAGLSVTILPQADEFPDSVFIEDAAICLKNVAIILRPGAKTRAGEATLLRPDLQQHFDKIIDLPGQGTIDGGDVMLSDEHAFIGLSQRTNEAGRTALADILAKYDYRTISVNTPADILHFKTECGLLDANTVFATRKLANTGCFDKYRVVETPPGEAAAANIVRINDVVLISAGFPKSTALLRDLGFKTQVLNTNQAALVDGGLSCMSLRF